MLLFVLIRYDSKVDISRYSFFLFTILLIKRISQVVTKFKLFKQNFPNEEPSY